MIVTVEKTEIPILSEEIVHRLITHHLIDYSNFMNDVLDLEEVFGIPRDECIKIVSKRYPQFELN